MTPEQIKALVERSGVKMPEPAEYKWESDGTFDIGQVKQLSPNNGPCSGWKVSPTYTSEQLHAVIAEMQEKLERMTKQAEIWCLQRWDLLAKLDKAQDELHCTEATLEAASCDLPEKGFDQGFDCMGDFALAVWQGFKTKLEAAAKDAARYQWLTEDHADYEVRMKVAEICDRISVMSKSAADAAIDEAMKEPK